MTSSECPICFDIIHATNQTITECGHVFHTNCLMKNVFHNGFGCPYCRTAMCEEPEESLQDEDEDDEEYSNTVNEDAEEEADTEELQDWLEQERIQRMEDRAFANLRRLFNDEEHQENEEEQEEEDDSEYTENDSSDSDSESDDDNSVSRMNLDSYRVRPTTDYITEKLTQRGITMGHLVKLMLAGTYPLYDDIMTRRHYRRDTYNLHDHVRDIINNYDAHDEEYNNGNSEEEEYQSVISLD